MTDESLKQRIERKLKSGELPTKSQAEIEVFENQLTELEANYRKSYSPIITNDANKTKALIAEHGPETQQGVFAFLPTTLTRTSPFFPISKQEMKDRSLPPGGLSWQGPWGSLTITGERLSIYDESVLLAVLAIMATRSRGKEKGLSFITTRHEICKVMNVAIGRNTYKAVCGSLDRLTGAKIRLEVWGKAKGKQKRRPRIMMVNTILSGAAMDEDTKELSITVNPYFLEMYAESLVTNINLKLRSELKGDIAKALYRFYRSQSGMTYEAHLLTLCKAINLDMSMEIWRLRTRIKSGLRELKRAKYLRRTMVSKTDIVKIWKEAKSTNVTIEEGKGPRPASTKAERPHFDN